MVFYINAINNAHVVSNHLFKWLDLFITTDCCVAFEYILYLHHYLILIKQAISEENVQTC